MIIIIVIIAVTIVDVNICGQLIGRVQQFTTLKGVRL
jgi:hypothetical protein